MRRSISVARKRLILLLPSLSSRVLSLLFLDLIVQPSLPRYRVRIEYQPVSTGIAKGLTNRSINLRFDDSAIVSFIRGRPFGAELVVPGNEVNLVDF